MQELISHRLLVANRKLWKFRVPNVISTKQAISKCQAVMVVEKNSSSAQPQLSSHGCPPRTPRQLIPSRPVTSSKWYGSECGTQMRLILFSPAISPAFSLLPSRRLATSDASSSRNCYRTIFHYRKRQISFWSSRKASCGALASSSATRAEKQERSTRRLCDCAAFSSPDHGRSSGEESEGQFIVVNFYHFVPIRDPESEVAKHLAFLKVMLGFVSMTVLEWTAESMAVSGHWYSYSTHQMRETNWSCPQIGVGLTWLC